jgi:hypothetical protein
MDPRVILLKAFYGGLPHDRAKIETYGHGFEFLEALLGDDGTTLEYGELTLSGLLHKYKLGRLTEHRMDELLQAHVRKQCNVCRYFAREANNLFCFNLDNNHKTNNTVVTPAMACAATALRGRLSELGCEPLVIASGRGYHVWCRLEAMVENDRLHDFMFHAAVHTMAALARAGHDHRVVKINVYPNRRIHDVVSLRLFGTNHAKNKVFSRILTPDRLLDEDESWAEFEHHLQHHTIPLDQFDAAHTAIMEPALGVLRQDLAAIRT